MNGLSISGIAFRLGAAMMVAALLSVFLVVTTVYVTVESRVRTSPLAIIEVRAFFGRVAQLCEDRPELTGECPKFISEALIVSSSNDASGRGPPPRSQRRGSRESLIDIIDPRPWIIPALIASTVFAATVALSAALLMGRHIAQPIQVVSKAAQAVAGGQLSTRVPIRARSSNSDETSQLALSFNRMAQSLEQNELERRQLIADIAHELRTPLAVMISRLEALEDGVFDLDKSEVTRLQVQTRFLARLVEDLRVLSSAETGHLSLERRSVDVEQLLIEVAQSFEARAEQVGKRIVVQSTAATINADPDRIRQVLSNLLENALKYAKREVRLQLQVLAGVASVTVADDGDGLATGEEQRVFDRFYRSDESRNRATGGSGLGLSIVKAIVELHGGRVSARNLEPHGAEFTVALGLL